MNTLTRHRRFAEARQPQIGKWFVSWRSIWDFLGRDQFARRLTICVMRARRDPPEGAEYSRDDYAGFIFTLCYRVPFYVARWR